MSVVTGEKIDEVVDGRKTLLNIDEIREEEEGIDEDVRQTDLLPAQSEVLLVKYVTSTELDDDGSR